VTERERALQLLTRIEKESLFASIALFGETGFVRTIVLGVLRWRSYIDHAIEVLAERRLKKLDPVVVEILRIGIYQLRFMDVAKHAAVSETVDLAGRHAKRARGFVNAILRRASERIPEPEDLATQFAHPAWLVDRWIRNYGQERTRRILKANQELSYPDVLIRDATQWNASVIAGGVPSGLVPGVIKLSGPSSDLDRADFHPMDEGSAVIAAITANAGDDILDLAAAPGGKTLYMTSRDRRVTSNDISLSRLRPIVGRTSRLVVSDALKPPFRGQFQIVLLDAPCSATGTIRKNPELKWRLREPDLVQFAEMQKRLFASALDLARETVIYSTCSLEPEENDEVVAATGNRFDRMDLTELVPSGAASWVEGGVLRLTPDSGADGFTAFALRRR
jgi:16S rRNA (cytosine967-C5)-methyltransferase